MEVHIAQCIMLCHVVSSQFHPSHLLAAQILLSHLPVKLAEQLFFGGIDKASKFSFDLKEDHEVQINYSIFCSWYCLAHIY